MGAVLPVKLPLQHLPSQPERAYGAPLASIPPTTAGISLGASSRESPRPDATATVKGSGLLSVPATGKVQVTEADLTAFLTKYSGDPHFTRHVHKTITELRPDLSLPTPRADLRHSQERFLFIVNVLSEDPNPAHLENLKIAARQRYPEYAHEVDQASTRDGLAAALNKCLSGEIPLGDDFGDRAILPDSDGNVPREVYQKLAEILVANQGEMRRFDAVVRETRDRRYDEFKFFAGLTPGAMFDINSTSSLDREIQIASIASFIESAFSVKELRIILKYAMPEALAFLPDAAGLIPQDFLTTVSSILIGEQDPALLDAFFDGLRLGHRYDWNQRETTYSAASLLALSKLLTSIMSSDALRRFLRSLPQIGTAIADNLPSGAISLNSLVAAAMDELADAGTLLQSEIFWNALLYNDGNPSPILREEISTVSRQFGVII